MTARKELSAGQKAAHTRKRRAAASKTVQTRRRISVFAKARAAEAASKLSMRSEKAKREDYKERWKEAHEHAKWAVTMTQVRIRQAIAQTPWPHWHLLTFYGPAGHDARGIVDLLAIRKDHRSSRGGTKRGDTFQIILIQVKGGGAAMPTVEDGKRLRAQSLVTIVLLERSLPHGRRGKWRVFIYCARRRLDAWEIGYR